MKCKICGNDSGNNETCSKECRGKLSVIRSGKAKYLEILNRKEELIKLFNEGKTISELCDYFGYKHGPIRKAIQELDLKPNKSVNSIRLKNKSSKISYHMLNERFSNDNEKKEYYIKLSKLGRDKNFNVISKLNRKFQVLLKENFVDSELEKQVGKYSYDLYVSNTLIELNPCISHCCSKSFREITGKGSNKIIEKNYHLNKTKNAVEHGFSCIHIWEWDDINKIVLMLKNKKRIYARETKIKEISKKEANVFLDKYHLQNSCRGNKINIGLFYNNELIQLMTFGKPRYNKNYDWELLRLCSKEEILVIGGASKIFKYFVKNYEGNIISYCDISKFSGKVYEDLGFALLRQTAPTRHWYNVKTKTHITDALLRQRGYDQLFNAHYGKGTSNEQLMFDNGFLDVFDCGQKVFTFDR